MNTSKDESDKDFLWRLTADQRQQIYEEEKRRIEQSAPEFSKKTKILIAVYLLGCVLIYFGIPQSFIELLGTGQWKYIPETDIFMTLFDSAVELIRPFLGGFICVLPFYVGFWAFGYDLLKYLRKFTNRDNKQNRNA